MIKKTLAMITAVIMLMGMLPCVSLAAKMMDSGMCGDNLTWTMDSNGTLTISGRGEMYNTEYNASMYSNYGWKKSTYDIHKLVIESGVTSIGAWAFEVAYRGMTGIMGSVDIPEGVTRIGFGAFCRNSGITSISLPSTLKKIDASAFYECEFTDIYYNGTSEDWLKIDIDLESNDILTKANIHVAEKNTVAGNKGSSTASKNVQQQKDEITVKLNGKPVSFDVPPQIINNRTLVPLRAIFEALGADVEWNGEKQTILAVKGGVRVLLQIGVLMIAKQVDNGDIKLIQIDSAPVIIDNRTLVPVRAVAESFDCTVDWDGTTRTVNIFASSGGF